MASFNIADVVNKLVEEDDASPDEIKFLVNLDIHDLADAADEAGEECDYLVKKILELAADDLSNFLDVKERIEIYWLALDEVPGGTNFEINVRAAEFIAKCNIEEKVSIEVLENMAKAQNWRERLVCAWTVRDSESEIAIKIRESFANDQFEDDNGIFLVREGAGFTDD